MLIWAKMVGHESVVPTESNADKDNSEHEHGKAESSCTDGFKKGRLGQGFSCLYTLVYLLHLNSKARVILSPESPQTFFGLVHSGMTMEPLWRLWQKEDEEDGKERVGSQGEGEPLGGKDDAEGGVAENPDHIGGHVAAADGATKLHGADLVEENSRRHGTKTHPSALHSPSNHEEEKGGGKVKDEIPSNGNAVADEEDSLPPQLLAGGDAEKHPDHHRHWCHRDKPGTLVEAESHQQSCKNQFI